MCGEFDIRGRTGIGTVGTGQGGEGGDECGSSDVGEHGVLNV